MFNESPLISFCIPTYNRCEILDKTLKSIVEQAAFDQRVEIIVSDNCSTDNTKNVVAKYQKKYNNIIYHCNEENILDENFAKALSLGNGKYLKLMNDTVMLKEDTIIKYLDIINKNIDEKQCIFFYENNFRHSFEEVRCSNINQLINTTSFYIGWVANFGAWKVDFDNLNKKNRYSFLQWLQMDWTLRLCENKDSVFFFDNRLESQLLKKKGGFNFFEVHVDNYLFVLQPYFNSGKLQLKAFRLEKTRLLKHFITHFIYMLLFKNDESFNYETKGWNKILWRHYKSYFSLYTTFIKQTVKFFLFYIKTKFIVWGYHKSQTIKYK